MKNKCAWFLLFVILATAALLAKTLLVKVVAADLRAKPDYLSSTLQAVKRGDEAALLSEAQGGWLLVTCRGRQGYLHRSALESASTSLTTMLPGEKGARSGELALAAKGFNEATEKNARGSGGFNYGDLDWVVQRRIATEKVQKFVAEGRLK